MTTDVNTRDSASIDPTKQTYETGEQTSDETSERRENVKKGNIEILS
jgi:hypothetical protein